MTNPSIIYNVYNVHIVLILLIQGISFTLGIYSLQADTYVLKIYYTKLEALLNDKFMNKLFSNFFYVGYDMACDVQNCLFLNNIWFVLPSQFTLYMHITPTCIHRYFSKYATQFHHSVKGI